MVDSLAMCFPIWICLFPVVVVAAVLAYGWFHGVRLWPGRHDRRRGFPVIPDVKSDSADEKQTKDDDKPGHT